MLRERTQAVVGALNMKVPSAVTDQTGGEFAGALLGSSCMPDAEIEVGTDQEKLSLQARVSHAVVRTMKDLYGRGPTHAKTYICDEYVFCVMSGGMTRDEETMIRGGEQDAVRAYRLRFQAVIAPEIIRRVEAVLERKVVSYHSQVLFDPDRLVEIFVLDSAVQPATPETHAPASA
jgi:uncharacterized protein YbcI